MGFWGGCFLFLKKSVELSNLHVITDECGRFICCDFTVSGDQWRIICVYAHNNVREREQFFRFLRDYVECDTFVALMATLTVSAMNGIGPRRRQEATVVGPS